MRIKKGDILIAKDTIKMGYSPYPICLIKGKRYKIDRYEDGDIVFKSEHVNDHYWSIEDLDRIFTKNITTINKNINIL